MSVNKVILIGNLGNDPEIRQFDNGMIATLSIATSERWTDKTTGERKEQTEWHRVVFNNRLAEIARDYLKKGAQIYVEGKIVTRKWQDQQTGQDRYSTEIRADVLQMLGSRDDAQSQARNQGTQPAPQQGYQQPTAQTRPMHQQPAYQGTSQPMQYGNPVVTPAQGVADDIPF